MHRLGLILSLVAYHNRRSSHFMYVSFIVYDTYFIKALDCWEKYAMLFWIQKTQTVLYHGKTDWMTTLEWKKKSKETLYGYTSTVIGKNHLYQCQWIPSLRRPSLKDRNCSIESAKSHHLGYPVIKMKTNSAVRVISPRDLLKLFCIKGQYLVFEYTWWSQTHR